MSRLLQTRLAKVTTTQCKCNAKVTTMFTRMMTMSLWQTKLAKAKFYADQDDDHDDDMDFKKDD